MTTEIMVTMASEDSTSEGDTLAALRAAIVFERNEQADAHYEAEQQAQARINAAHLATLRMVKRARAEGVTKTTIAMQLGVKNLYRVNQLIEEAAKL